jgi:DNA/RNA endonuclease YhcR with UshA esterase domain
MKKILLGVAAMLLSFAFSANAQLMVEHFDYTAGTDLTSNGWTAHSAAGNNPMTVGTASLTFPTYSPAAIGGSGVCIGNSEDINKDFPFVSSGSVYTSFLLRVDTIGGTGYFFHFMDTLTGSFQFRARTFFQEDASNPSALNFGLTFNSSSGVFDTTEFMLGDTLLVVAKYTIIPGIDNDEVSLFVFDGSTSFATEPSTPLLGPVTGTSDDIEPGRIAIRQFNSGTDLTVDAFMVDTVWNLAPAAGLAQIDLPITWDDTANIDYTTTAFEGGISAAALDPINAANNVLQFVKPAGAQPWAGVTLSTPAGLANTIPFSVTDNLISAKVYSPAVGTTLMLKTEVAGSPTLFVETTVTTTVANAWETVTFDFSSPSTGTMNYTLNYSLISFVPDFLTAAAGDTFYVDNVYFGAPANPAGLPTYDIATISSVDADGVADSLGVNCWTSGVVMGVDMDGNAGLSFTLWDNEGINIFNFNDVSNYTVTEGDSLMVMGTVDQFNGLTQFFVDSIIVANQGNAIPAPTVISSLVEMHESELVRIEDYFVYDVDGANLVMVNGTDTVVMRIDNDTDIDENITFAVGDTVCYAIGIGGQFDSSSPYTSGYQMFPQRAADVDNSCGGIPPPAVPFAPIKDINNVDANGEPDSNGLVFWTRGVVVGIDLDGNNGISFTIFDEEGINVYNFNDVSNYVVTEGDSIMVRGEIDFFNGLTEIFPDSIMLINSGNPVPAHAVVTTLGEETESAPIQMFNVMVIDANDWSTSGSFNIELLTCSGDTVAMRVDSDTDVADSFAVAPSGMFSVKGIGGQFDSSTPYLSGYQIFPMSAADFDTTGNVAVPSLSVNEVMTYNMTTVADGNGEFDAWVELYNPSAADVALGGLYFTNDSTNAMQYMVPGNSSAMIAAGGYALVWCDNQPTQGDLHTNFVLDTTSMYFGVTFSDGCNMTAVDAMTFPMLAADRSFGRSEDGGDSLMLFPKFGSTPNAMNMVDATNSIGDVTVEEAQLVVYPNPSNGSTVVRFNEVVTFDVFNVLGNIVTSGSNTNELNIGGLSNGAYFIRTNNGEVIRMIVK